MIPLIFKEKNKYLVVNIAVVFKAQKEITELNSRINDLDASNQNLEEFKSMKNELNIKM